VRHGTGPSIAIVQGDTYIVTDKDGEPSSASAVGAFADGKATQLPELDSAIQGKTRIAATLLLLVSGVNCCC
jgi:hypothetical protein